MPKSDRPAVSTSREDKVLLPDGFTKGDLIEHHRRIAPAMLPHLAGRPVVMQRFPDGLSGGGFFHKQVPDHFPEWIRTVTVEKKEGGRQKLALCNDRRTLVYLADQACVTLHAWTCRADRPRSPDRMVFDLDPPDDGDDFDPVRRAARTLREVLREIAPDPFLLATGSRGLHVVVPLRRERGVDVDDVRALARDAGGEAVRRRPDGLTAEIRKEKRRGRVYVDVARNAYAQTVVAPYSVRARPGAPIAVPLDWHELADRSRDSRSCTVGNVFRRLARKRDPWRHLARHAASPRALRRRLDARSG